MLNSKLVKFKKKTDEDIISNVNPQRSTKWVTWWPFTARNLGLDHKFIVPYEVTQKTGFDQYGFRKVSVHEGAIIISSSADYMKPWVNHIDLSEAEE